MAGLGKSSFGTCQVSTGFAKPGMATWQVYIFARYAEAQSCSVGDL